MFSVGLAMDLRARLASLSIKPWSLGDQWEALHEPDQPGKDWGLSFPTELYCQIFDRQFPQVSKNKWKARGKCYVTYFRGISDEDLASVRTFVDAIRPYVVIKVLTDGSMALAFRAAIGASGDLEATDVGRLMRAAKPYNEAPNKDHRRAGTALACRLCALVEAMPLYRDVYGFVAIPCAGSKKFSLPRGFAYELARRTGKANLSEAVTKTKLTPELKNLSLADKLEAILDSVTVDKAKVAGKSIVVVDDLYQSGLTINYVAEELRLAGAREVFGLAAVKTLSNVDNLPKSTVPPQTGDDGDDEILF